MSIETLTLAELKPLLNKSKVVQAVTEALIFQSQGKVQSPPPGESTFHVVSLGSCLTRTGQLLFNEPYGDCHIKFGHVQKSESFVIKIATGFYENPKLGLPALNGLVTVWDAKTGQPKLLLKDEGWLTAWRTAAATVIAAKTLAPAKIEAVGVLGTGLQAVLAIEWLAETLGEQKCLVWGRTFNKAVQVAEEQTKAGRKVTAVENVRELLDKCNVIITATPSNKPLFAAEWVRPGTHVVGLGADSPGKQEIPSELFSRAAHILTDDTAQCVDHGDYGCAIKAGCVKAGQDTMLGKVLSGAVKLTRKDQDITIVDLTGIAAEDIAIATLFEGLARKKSSL